MENTASASSSRAATAASRSNRYVPLDSQAPPHLASSPSSAGLSGILLIEMLPVGVVSAGVAEAIVSPVRYVRHRVDKEVPECGVCGLHGTRAEVRARSFTAGSAPRR